MAEIFGIHRVSGLTSNDSLLFDRLQAAFVAWHAGASEEHRDVRSAVGLIRHHPADSATLRVPKDTDTWAAWLGKPPASGLPEPEKLQRLLSANDSKFVETAIPPFALAVGGGESGSLWVGSDPFGLYPIHFHRTVDGLLLYSTKLLPMLATKAVSTQLDSSAVVQFFTFEHVTGNRTFLADVELLPPGSVLRHQPSGLGHQRWSEPMLRRGRERLALRPAATELYERLCDAVATATRGFERIAVTLSGGLDSRALLGCMLARDRRPTTFTFGRPKGPDAGAAAELARGGGLSHTLVALDDGFLDAWLDRLVMISGGMVNAVHARICSLTESLESAADVVVDGLAGDALTGAHLTPGMFATRSADTAAAAVYANRASAWSSEMQRSLLFEPEFFDTVEEGPQAAVRRHFEGSPSNAVWWGCHRFDLLERQRRFIQYGPHYLRPHLAVVTPFYAPEIVRLLLSLGPAALFEQRVYLRMHRVHLADQAQVPDDKRGVPVSWPWELRLVKKAWDIARRRIIRPPAPTSDIDAWFRGPLRSLLEARLLDDPGATEGVLRRPSIEAVIGAHLTREADHGLRLGCLLTFAAFRRAALDITSA